jgi:AcrR family transcriptional regulator
MTEAPAEGLRARHKHRTRMALRDAALRRFIRDGFEATTVEDIAADVDVSPRTFFRYFPTKDAVVVTPYLALFDSWEEVVRSAPAGTALIDALRKASHLVTEAYERDPEFWDLHHEAITTDPTIGLRMLQTQAQLQQRATRALGDLLALDPRDDIRPHVLAAASMAGVGAAVARWYATGREADRRALVDAAYEDVARAAELLHRPLPTIEGADRPGPVEPTEVGRVPG